MRIPGGFHIAEDSATKVEDGIVIEDDIGNQFVWIPAKTGTGTIIHTTAGDKTIVYKRTSFDGKNITSTYMGRFLFLYNVKTIRLLFIGIFSISLQIYKLFT